MQTQSVVVQGLADMHKAGITPADVKLGNMMLDPSKLQGGQGPLCKLVDLGMATFGIHLLPRLLLLYLLLL